MEQKRTDYRRNGTQPKLFSAVDDVLVCLCEYVCVFIRRVSTTENERENIAERDHTINCFDRSRLEGAREMRSKIAHTMCLANCRFFLFRFEEYARRA